MTTPRTVHVLRRRNWRFAGDYLVLLPGHVRLQSYADGDEAARVCGEKNRTIRARVNPFRCGGPSLRNQTSLDAGRLHDWALDQGLTPPEGDDWVAWWDEQFPQMDALQRDGMWKALDRLSFYEVVEQPERPVVYIAVAINWEHNLLYYLADGEGGETRFAFRTREEAEDYAEEANKLQREQWHDPALAEDPEEGRAFDMRYRRQSLEDIDSPWRDPYTSRATTDEVAFVEIVEVEFEGRVVGRKDKLYLVQRLAWCLSPNAEFQRGMCQQHNSPEGVPVRAFRTKEEAAKYATELTVEARRESNPFQFFDWFFGIMKRGEQELLDALAKLDLPTPTHEIPSRNGGRFIDWPRWHDEIADSLIDEERDAIWKLYERLELYRVVEVEFL